MNQLSVLPDLQLPPGYKVDKHIPTAPLDGVVLPVLFPDAPRTNKTFRAVMADFEATGLDVDVDEPIEIGLVDISVCAFTGKPVKINAVLSQLNEPTRPLSPEINEITGLTDDDLKGERFDLDAIDAFIRGGSAEAPILVAHNVDFDKQWLDMIAPQFEQLPIACSLNDIDWSQLNVMSKKQEALLKHFGYWYEAHRATTDCLALAWLNALAPDLFLRMYEAARQSTYRVCAWRFPIEHKDILKLQHKYTWNGRVWYKDVKGDDALNETLDILRQCYIDVDYEPSNIGVETIFVPDNTL